jgi:CheY-like chemotaxis protein
MTHWSNDLPLALRAASKKAMKPQILVVDDDESLRELVRRHLENAGYEVRTAEDGIAAGHAVLAQVPDMVICDIRMPYMSGLEFLAVLRADNTLPRIPVIFLTHVEDAEERARLLGGSDFLLKPVRVDTLLAAVARHLKVAVASEVAVASG